MVVEDPADWERAWDEYLEPLSERYPDQYVAEVAAAREKVEAAHKGAGGRGRGAGGGKAAVSGSSYLARKRDLLEAILAYQKRDRRYGGINQPAVAGR